MRELPQLVQLHQQHGDDLLCVTLNMDYIGGADGPSEALQDKALKILKARDASCVNVVSSDADEDIYAALDLGAIPAVLVYDKQGELRKRFDNDKAEYGAEGFSYEKHVAPLVESLLAE